MFKYQNLIYQLTLDGILGFCGIIPTPFRSSLCLGDWISLHITAQG